MPRSRLILGQPPRVAMISLHTSPLERPGSGDAGGMNVFVDAVSRALVARGSEVEVFTRADRRGLVGTVEVVPGYRVHHLVAGPKAVSKEDLPRHVGAFAHELGRRCRPGSFDVVHSHYWLSGLAAGAVAAGWGVPWVHSMHTLARVKNASRADGERPEPGRRVTGERQVVAGSDLLVANTGAEAADLVRWYGAHPERVRVVHPGVDLDQFSPGDRESARRAIGLRPDQVVLLFVGRLQPLKGPDVLLRAVAELVQLRPTLRDSLQVVLCGGPSGPAGLRPESLAGLAVELGISGLVRFVPPMDRSALVTLYRAADVTVVPSHTESFGLVAIESQACGTPVVATRVGGLSTAVADGVSGLLINDHDPQTWAQALLELVSHPERHRQLSAGALRHAADFSWSATAAGLLASYQDAQSRLEAHPVRAAVG